MRMSPPRRVTYMQRGAEPRGSAPSPLAYSLPLKSATASSSPARRIRTSERVTIC